MDAAGAREQRRRLLPARLVMYVVLALWLFRGRDRRDGQGCTKPGGRLVARQIAQTSREFTGTLTDVTAEPVVLDPCPYYVESLGGRVVGNTTPPPGFPSAKPWRGEPIYAGYAKEAYELNCADVQSIPAGGAATFAMRLRVPLDAAGPETLRWHLVVAGRDIETASAPLVIDPAP